MKRNASSVESHSGTSGAACAHGIDGAMSPPGRGPQTGTLRYVAPSSCAPAPPQPAFAASGFQWFASQAPLHHGGAGKAVTAGIAVRGSALALSPVGSGALPGWV